MGLVIPGKGTRLEQSQRVMIDLKSAGLVCVMRVGAGEW